MNLRLVGTLATCLVFCVGQCRAAVTIDRDYQLGDDSIENAELNGEVGEGFTNDMGDRFTADSVGVSTMSPFVDFQDAQVLGAPLYRDVSSRPLSGGSGLGVEFDGVDDVLQGDPLNIIEESAAAVPGFPFIYADLRARGLQMWVRPDAAGLSAGVRQTIVMDTVESGGVAITADGNWTQAFDNELDDEDIPATVPVVADTWHHVMHHIHPTGDPGAPVTVVGGEAGFTGVVYVNGIAVSASNDFPDDGGLTAGDRVGVLSIGAAELADQDTDPTTADYGEFFDGTIDDLELYVFGDNSDVVGGQDYGTFNLFTDNEWIANQIDQAPLNGTLLPGDVNRDGVVDVAGDVPAFVAGWLSENRIEGWGWKSQHRG